MERLYRNREGTYFFNETYFVSSDLDGAATEAIEATDFR